MSEKTQDQTMENDVTIPISREDMQSVSLLDGDHVRLLFNSEQAEELTEKHSTYDYNVESNADQAAFLHQAELTETTVGVTLTAPEEEVDDFLKRLSGNAPDRYERSRRRHGWLHSGSSPRIWNDTNRCAGPLVITESGDFASFVQEAKDDLRRSESTLWNRLGPLEYDGLEISKNTQVYHDEREEWLKADTINVYESGQPVVRFMVKESWPVEHLTLEGEMIESLREEGVLLSNEEVSNNAMELLEAHREGA